MTTNNTNTIVSQKLEHFDDVRFNELFVWISVRMYLTRTGEYDQIAWSWGKLDTINATHLQNYNYHQRETGPQIII